MYDILKKPIYEDYRDSGLGTNLYKLQIKNTYCNNDIYHIEAIYYESFSFCMNDSGSRFDLDSETANEYVSIINQLFNFKGWPFGELWPTFTYDISFSIQNEDIVIKDNLLFIPVDKIINFNANIKDKKLYSYKDYTCNNIDELINSGDKTNILLSHKKGKEIYEELFFQGNDDCGLDPEYNSGDFLYFNHGFEFKEESI